MIDAYHKFLKAKCELEMVNGREATTDELVKATGIASVKIECMGGLLLDQPISLDDLVGGTSAAGPYLSPAWPTSEDLTSVNGEGASSAGGSMADTQFTPLVLPKREPKYVPVNPEEPPAPPETPKGALEDDVPTRRLPIYQSVLSRWFSEEGEPEAPVEPPAPDYLDRRDERREALLAENNYPAEQTVYVPTEQVAAPAPPPAPVVAEEQPEPQVIAQEQPYRLPEPQRGWESAADNGWQAAQALLETKDEEITPAGLPKRVPNAYLVPGSVGPSEQDVFTDAAVAQPGKGSIARSATAARSRMASFQRGYTSGRHAMKEHSAETRSDAGVSVSGGGMGSLSEDSSEERQ
jgi:hypothetical protein